MWLAESVRSIVSDSRISQLNSAIAAAFEMACSDFRASVDFSQAFVGSEHAQGSSLRICVQLTRKSI